MSLTGQLGTTDSQLGNVALGNLGPLGYIIVNQILTITQSNSVTTPNQHVLQNLTISQDIVHTGDFAKSASNSLSIIQSADYFRFTPIAINQSLTITQSNNEVATTGLHNELAIIQDAIYQYDPHFDQQFQVLTPTQVVGVAAIFSRTVTQPLVITQVAARTKIITRSVVSTLGIHQNVIEALSRNAFSTLTLTQTVVVVVYRNKLVQNNLHITHSVGLQLILNRSLISTLLFKKEHLIANGSGGFLNAPNLIFTRGGLSCCSVANLTTTVFQSSIRAIVLPNPEYNDTEGLVAAVNIKRTITGGTFSYIKKSSNRKLKYKFTINQRKAYEIRKFLLDFLGDRLIMTNFKGEIWSGFILTDPSEITSTMRGGACIGDLYTIDLEFQGVKVN